VLAVAITTKGGKLLLSRQYIDMSRIRIEGLLTAFPKLVGTEKEHTYVETSSVRYVYQPVEQLYVMLVTTKMSNIVEDLETLRLLAKIVQEHSPQYDSISEKAVNDTAFEIIQAFDEVIDWGGYRENVNLDQVAQFTTMFSNEELLAKRMEEMKVKEATTTMEKKAAVLKQQKGDDKVSAIGNELGRFMEKTGLGGLANDLGFAHQRGGGGATQGFGDGISSESYQRYVPCERCLKTFQIPKMLGLAPVRAGPTGADQFMKSRLCMFSHLLKANLDGSRSDLFDCTTYLLLQSLVP